MREGELGVDLGRGEAMVGDVEESCLLVSFSPFKRIVS